MRNIPENTKAIIFDLGGVVIDIEWQRSVHAFANLTKSTFDELNQLMRKQELVQKIETGVLQPEAFRAWFRDQFQNGFSDNEIDSAWNAMLLDIPLERVELIKNLAKEFTVMCLSNTNAIHVNAFNKILEERCGHKHLGEFMHRTYFSHDMGTRKPDPESWKIILRENQLEPDSVLYFDDNENNHLVATELGLNSVLIDKDYTIEKYFNE